MASRDIKDLRPEAQVLAQRFILSAANAGVDFIITCTLRSLDEQASLYAKGRTSPPLGSQYWVTKSPPGSSAHNYGLAFDFVPSHAGKPVWDEKDPAWAVLGAIGTACGLDWGGTWVERGITKNFNDLPHLQHPDWKRLACVK